MRNLSFDVVIAGEAGQGLVTIGDLLSRILVKSGYYIVVTQGYESRIRGGHNTYSIAFSPQKILAPGDTFNMLVSLDLASVDILTPRLAKDASVVVDASYSKEFNKLVKVPYAKLAGGKFVNVVALGIVSYMLALDKELVEKVVMEFLGSKSAQVSNENITALKKAYEWCAAESVEKYKLDTAVDKTERLLLNGNDAIALGAISAGLKFYSFYPMTPSTSISLAVIKHAQDMGIFAWEAEDEISAINMAIGASYAGAPAMVATSGGGFALMVEGVSLAAMTETPIVIAVAQRPAPATGLPTRTEQADLEFVLHSGHGEFPRAIFAPGTVEDCFRVTRKAFEVAWKYQTPVFILTDQFLADSYRAVAPFTDVQVPKIIAESPSYSGSEKYLRHKITDDGISLRLFPGMTDHLVVTDSDEHTEDGHITEDLHVRKLMVEKRLKKLEGVIAEVVPPELIGDDGAEILFVCWGSTMGAAVEASKSISAKGKSAAVLYFSQVWPLKSDQFMKYLKNAKKVVAVEGNATSQLARLIRRETGFDIEMSINRYDGLPITPEYIIGALKNVITS